MPGFGRLPERPARDLRDEAEEPRPIPREADDHPDQQGQRRIDRTDAPAARRGRGDEDRGQHVGGERRLRQHAESEDHSHQQRPSQPDEPLGSERYHERQRDHRRQRQIELEPQRREHDERRAAEDDRGDDAFGAAGQTPPQRVNSGHADAQEREDDRLGRGRIRRRQPVHDRRGTRDDRRVKRRALHESPPIAPCQVLGAADDALEVVGVVPLGRRAVDRQPHRSDQDQGGEGRGDDRPLAGAGRAVVRHRRPIRSSEAPNGSATRGTR